MKPTPIKTLLLGFALLAFGWIYSALSPASHSLGSTAGFAGLFLIVGSLGWMWGKKSSKDRQ